MKVTFETPAIVDTEMDGGIRFWVTFESPPNVELGQEYRTFYPALSHPDAGSFVALWVDGNRMLAKSVGGWYPPRGHVVLP